MKYIYLSIAFSFISIWTFAQYPLVTIEEIQNVAESSLTAGNDVSPLFGDTVRVAGVVTFNPCDYALSGSGSRVGSFMEDGDYGLHVLVDNSNGYGDIQVQDETIRFQDNFVMGNEVEVTGYISAFSNNTQLILLPPNEVVISGVGNVTPTVVEVADLMDFDNGELLPNLVDGERYEGKLIELQNVTIVDVVAGTNGRFFWSVQDDMGRKVQIRDVSGQFRNDANDDFCSGGDDVSNTPDIFDPIPLQNANIEFLRGIMVDYTNSGGVRDYYIAPRSSADIGPVQAAFPVVSETSVSPQIPGSNDDVVITASISDSDGSIDNAFLCYGPNEPYLCIPMTDNGDGTFSATIPAYANGNFVYYQINATDNEGNTASFNSIGDLTLIYPVLDGGITSIADIQTTPLANGASVLWGQTISNMDITATITAGAQSYDLGFIYAQQGSDPYSGISIIPNSDDGLAELKRGTVINITGAEIDEINGDQLTALRNLVYTVVATCQDIPEPIGGVSTADIRDNTSNVSEAHESMLLTFNNVFVTDTNPDSDFGSNFGEWAISETSGDDNGLRCDDRSNDLPFDFNTLELSEGQSMAFLNGILTYSFGNWKMYPRNLADMDGYSTEYAKAITSFFVPASNVFGSVNESDLTISLNLPGSADITNVIPDIIFEGDQIEPASGTAIDLSSPVVYTVSSCIDGSTQTYTVSATITSIVEADEIGIQIQPTFIDQAFEVKNNSNQAIDFIKVYNVNGELQKQVAVQSNSTTVNISTLPSGVYVVELNLADQKVIEKIVKQ